MSAGSHQ